MRAVSIVCLTAGLISAAQAPEPFRITSAKEAKFQEEIDRAVADGYRLAHGDASVQLAIWERASDNQRRSYVYAADVEKFLKEKRLQAGFRLVPGTFSANQYRFSALFEKADGDDVVRDYRFAKAGSPGGLRKRFEEGGEGSTGAIAVASGGAGAAVLFDPALTGAATLISSGNTGTLREQLQAAAAKGQCFVDADGIKEAVYLVAACPQGSAGPAYEVLSTTKADTLEKELNEAAARGLRLIPQSLVGIEKRFLMNAYNNEAVAVVQKTADPTQVTYRVLSTVRVGTMAKELQAAGADGFRLLSFAIGPKEVAAILAK
jgi:hypothetical protein